MKNVGLLLIATNKYIQFLPKLIKSADLFFCSNDNVEYHIFTDHKSIDIQSARTIVVHDVPHQPWPYATLFRYHFFKHYSLSLNHLDYIYYCDADMLFVDNVGREIFGELVATIHPGFLGGRGTPETRSSSLAFVSDIEHMTYFAGGFNGGSTSNFLSMANTISASIDTDLSHNIIAIWHDESHLNRYLIDHKPSIILDPGYCYPESWLLPFNKKLLALDKNHQEIRG